MKKKSIEVITSILTNRKKMNTLKTNIYSFRSTRDLRCQGNLSPAVGSGVGGDITPRITVKISLMGAETAGASNGRNA